MHEYSILGIAGFIFYCFFLEVLFAVGISCLLVSLMFVVVVVLLFVVGPIVVAWVVLFAACCNLTGGVVL